MAAKGSLIYTYNVALALCHFFFLLILKKEAKLRIQVREVMRPFGAGTEQCTYTNWYIINYRVEEDGHCNYPGQIFNYRFDEFIRDSHSSQFQRTDSFRSGFLSRVRIHRPEEKHRRSTIFHLISNSFFRDFFFFNLLLNVISVSGNRCGRY